ncbi:MAG: hypothetical protein U0Q22_17095 [Acidimicrobiales bacterium]
MTPPTDGSAPVPDGTYEVFIIDATPDPADDGKVTGIDITVVTGPNKGEAFALAADGLVGSDIDLIGMPATLVVTGGVPTVTLDDSPSAR